MRNGREDDARAVDEAEASAEKDDAAVGGGAGTEVEDEAPEMIDENIEDMSAGRVADEPPLLATPPPPAATELLLPLNVLDSMPLLALLPCPVLRDPLPLTVPPLVLDPTADDVSVRDTDDCEVWNDVDSDDDDDKAGSAALVVSALPELAATLEGETGEDSAGVEDGAEVTIVDVGEGAALLAEEKSG